MNSDNIDVTNFKIKRWPGKILKYLILPFLSALILVLILIFSASNVTKMSTHKGVTPMIKDYDGNIYTEIKIGNQVWLKENLKTKHYNNGKKIEGVFSYDDDENNVSKYGRLYNWDALKEGDPCPIGYKIASDEDYKNLEKYLGMSDNEINKLGWRKSNKVSILIKENDNFLFWQNNKNIVNQSGFSSMPAGVRSPIGKFFGLNNYADYWTSTEDLKDSTKAVNRSLVWFVLHPGKNKIYRSKIDKKWAFSVRMIKNNK